MADDGGVLGNLPRSRPGTRSEKRAGAAAAKAADRAERRGTAAAEAAPGSRPRGPERPKPATAGRAAAEAATGQAAQPAVPDRNPIGAAILTATKLAGASVRVAGAVAGKIVRRLPRP